jgi:hypothetical protein
MFFVLLAIFQIAALWTTFTAKSVPDQLPRPLMFLAYAVTVTIVLLLVFGIMYLAARGQFTVTEEGLSARYCGILQVVRWQEARLVACVAGQQFELASPGGIVRVSLLGEEAFLTPNMPFQRYREEMSAVFALIAERTGLPLMDVESRRR